MEYLALFFTQSGAMKFFRLLKQKGIQAEMMPVPRALSSSCGIAVRLQYDGAVESLLWGDIEKLYEIDKSEYRLLFECDRT